jgi:uncharacterized protein (DUF1330 family)
MVTIRFPDKNANSIPGQRLALRIFTIHMIYITQLVYVKPGQEGIFETFEQVALPLISRYKGRLLLRIRPDTSSFIQGEAELPYEIHLVTFPSDTEFEKFAKDPERASMLHVKEASVDRIVLIKGHAL